MLSCGIRSPKRVPGQILTPLNRRLQHSTTPSQSSLLSASSLSKSRRLMSSSKWHLSSKFRSSSILENSSHRCTSSKCSKPSPVTAQDLGSESSEPLASWEAYSPSEAMYLKVKPSHIPRGWSNDPVILQACDCAFPSQAFGLQVDNIDPRPVLAKGLNSRSPCYLLKSGYGPQLYLWYPVSSKLHLVTEQLSLEGILQRLEDGQPELQTKELLPFPEEHCQVS